jgi:membrane-bound lytic murein transglycosylase C
MKTAALHLQDFTARLRACPAFFRRIFDIRRPDPLQFLRAGFFPLGAACLTSLVFALYFAVDFRENTGPFGPVARLSVSLDRLETVDARHFSQGLDTSFPLNAGALAASGRQNGVFSLSAAPGGSVVRGDVSQSGLVSRHRFPGFEGPEKDQDLVRFAHGLVSIETVDGPVPVTRLRQSPLPVMPGGDMFELSFFAPAGRGPDGIRAPALYGESLDESGRPERWSRPEPVSASGFNTCEDRGEKHKRLLSALIRGLGVPGASGSHSVRAGKYRGYVSRYAEQYGLASSLILAIMHTESGFNPFAVSRSQAVGLMQIVPDTAGHEAHRYLTGTPGAPSLETLFAPESNIRYGVAYLHLLARRYFGGVANSGSRQMCVIAAYNGGPGAVLRLFDPDPDAAVARINSMSPEQVYAALTTEMPNAETRRYVDLVLGRLRNYSVH